MNGNEEKLVRTSREVHNYILDLHRKIVSAYKKSAVLFGVNPASGKKGPGPKVKHAVDFLIRHAVYTQQDIEKFALEIVRKNGGGRNAAR